MSPQEVRKLLGGYATGTLTPEEREALFSAALDDQELFDALAREQSLRDLLRDPAAKAQVLAALETARVPWYRQGWWKPALVAAAMAGIAGLVVVATWRPAAKPQAVTVAEVRERPAPQPPPAAEAQASAPRARREKPVASAAPVKEERTDALSKNEAVPAPVAAAEPASATASAAPALPRFSTQTVEVQAQAQAPMPQAQQRSQQGAQLGQLGLRDTAAGGGGGDYSRLIDPTARLLFYGNPVVAAAEADSKQKLAKKAAANTMAASSGLGAFQAVHLGVRCSIVRKLANGETAEVGIDTLLDAGEQVSLKLVPNESGYWRVWEGSSNAVGSGRAEPLQPVEIGVPAGARQLHVQFTRDRQDRALPVPPGGNLVQSVAEEKATYVVNRVSAPAGQQLVVTITLNYK